MKINILTLFPDMFAPLFSSIIGRAAEKKIIEINVVDIRAYSLDKHKKCDDMPFGGGDGMVMTPQPIADCIAATDPHHECIRIYMSPKGEVLSSKMAASLASKNKDLLLLCGHYEGIDERVLKLFIDQEISIGDFVLTGGELPAMVLCDCVCRYITGVLGSSNSPLDESFENGLLEYPQYTRPQEFMGQSVPEVLLSGHHKNIEKWRLEQSLELTKLRRPELLEKRKN